MTDIHSQYMLISFPGAHWAIRDVCGFPCQMNWPSCIALLWWHQWKCTKVFSEAGLLSIVRMLLRKVAHCIPAYENPGEIVCSGSPEDQVWFLTYECCKSCVLFCFSHIMSPAQLGGLRTRISGTTMSPGFISTTLFAFHLFYFPNLLLINLFLCYILKCIYISLSNGYLKQHRQK